MTLRNRKGWENRKPVYMSCGTIGATRADLRHETSVLSKRRFDDFSILGQYKRVRVGRSKYDLLCSQRELNVSSN